MNSFGRPFVVVVGTCSVWCATWPEGVGSRWSSLVCPCFLPFLIWVGLPHIMGLLRALLSCPVALTVCDPSWVSEVFLCQLVCQGPTSPILFSVVAGLHAGTSALCRFCSFSRQYSSLCAQPHHSHSTGSSVCVPCCCNCLQP